MTTLCFDEGSFSRRGVGSVLPVYVAAAGGGTAEGRGWFGSEFAGIRLEERGGLARYGGVERRDFCAELTGFTHPWLRRDSWGKERRETRDLTL